ncbi:unnamed protein product, partial [Didymodactylos carnosus]
FHTMKLIKKIIISRTEAGFGFTLRHFVIYPPSTYVNDLLQASYSVIIDEHQQKTTTTNTNDNISGKSSNSSSSGNQSGVLLTHSTSTNNNNNNSNNQQSMRIISNDVITADNNGGTNSTTSQDLLPMDTIFVKEVRQDGQAYQAGLRQGDRILSVNDQTINGKSYSQVIAMIQNTPGDLVLSVVPKEDDILQLAYSDTAYNQAHSPYSGTADRIPEPPSVKYLPQQQPSSSSSYRVNDTTVPSSFEQTKPRRTSAVSATSSQPQSYRPAHPTQILNPKQVIENKLRNLQLNIAQGREDEFAKAGIYFPQPAKAIYEQPKGSIPTQPRRISHASENSPPTTNYSQPQPTNAFSKYIESVHRALDNTTSTTPQRQQQPEGVNTDNEDSIYSQLHLVMQPPPRKQSQQQQQQQSYYQQPRYAPLATYNDYSPYEYSTNDYRQQQPPPPSFQVAVQQQGNKEQLFLTGVESGQKGIGAGVGLYKPYENHNMPGGIPSNTYYTLPPRRISTATTALGQPQSQQQQWIQANSHSHTPLVNDYVYQQSPKLLNSYASDETLRPTSIDTALEEQQHLRRQAEQSQQKQKQPQILDVNLKSPSTETNTCSNEGVNNPQQEEDEDNMKTEFVNFRKKQFETGHVENVPDDRQRERLSKKYSEKKKYESEWNRITSVADVESVMERASHFEDIDPDKFARLRSKLPTSPPPSSNGHGEIEQKQYELSSSPSQQHQQMKYGQGKLMKHEDNHYQTLQQQHISRDELGNIEFSFDPRYLIQQQPQQQQSGGRLAVSNYSPNQEGQRYLSHPSSQQQYMDQSSNPSRVNLVRQQSYITAVRSSMINDQQSQQQSYDMHDADMPGYDQLERLLTTLGCGGSSSGEYLLCTPKTMRPKVSPFTSLPVRPSASDEQQEWKQRRASYLIATDQKYQDQSFHSQSSSNKQQNEYGYDMTDDQKLRNTPQQQQAQTQAIRKLKNFFGEGTPQVLHALDHPSSTSQQQSRASLSQSPQSSLQSNQSKSSSFFNSSSPPATIPLTTMVDNIEPSKEGILYCKMVLKDGRRAPDRSWRGAWAVLRGGALFLGKEKKHGLLIPLSCDSFPINLKDADVELASDYIKKPRVFKVITATQCEFLFQAPDMQSLHEWLEVVREHCCSITSSENDISRGGESTTTPGTASISSTQRPSTASLPPIVPHHTSEQDLSQRLSSSTRSGSSSKPKSKLSLRSPSLKRSPSLRFRKSQKSASQSQQGASTSSASSGIGGSSSSMLSAHNNGSGSQSTSPRRSFVKIVKKGLKTLKSGTSIGGVPQQMSGQVYDENILTTSTTSTTDDCNLSGINFGIELEECESSSISRSIPIVVEILCKLVEIRGITYTGIYRHAGGLTAVNWLVNELDKGCERVDFQSEKWYDIKAVASTLKTFFAKLPDSLISSKMSSLFVEASRIDCHRDRLIELKKLVTQLNDNRFETLRFLCAHFRRVASKCDINKIDARNLAIIFGPTLIWDSKASLQSNLVDNPEKIRIIEAFILYHEWFFEHGEYDDIPYEINPQMPKLNCIYDDTLNESKPSEIIQHIVRAAKRRWSSPMLLDTSVLSQTHRSSIGSGGDSQKRSSDDNSSGPSKPVNIFVKRSFKKRSTMATSKSSACRSRSVDSSLNSTLSPTTTAQLYCGESVDVSIALPPRSQNQELSEDSAVHSMSDIVSSSTTTSIKSTEHLKQRSKKAQSLKDLASFFKRRNCSEHSKTKQTTLTPKSSTSYLPLMTLTSLKSCNSRGRKLRKKLNSSLFIQPVEDFVSLRSPDSSKLFSSSPLMLKLFENTMNNETTNQNLTSSSSPCLVNYNQNKINISSSYNDVIDGDSICYIDDSSPPPQQQHSSLPLNKHSSYANTSSLQNHEQIRLETSKIKQKLHERDTLLNDIKQQSIYVNQTLSKFNNNNNNNNTVKSIKNRQEDIINSSSSSSSKKSTSPLSLTKEVPLTSLSSSIKRRHTFNSVFDYNLHKSKLKQHVKLIDTYLFQHVTNKRHSFSSNVFAKLL